MRLRLGQDDRHRLRGDEPNQSFANHQPGSVNSVPMESFCREQLEYIAGAADVDRAHFGNKIAGDQHGDLVQMLLRCSRAGHHIAQITQQAARTRPRR